jgi:hypothetical protein
MYTTKTPIDMRHFNVRYTDSDYHFGKSKIWGYQKWKIQRNWHHSVHKAKKIKIKTQLLDTIMQANTNYVV